jgi:sugar/nucleoside kinase (ribokinase family)/fructoselysine-6-P-deglycase FrlB-like protein
VDRASFIIGVGELIYDHIFYDSGQGLKYYGSRGGGSFSNFLANIASKGGKAVAFGVGGQDRFGQAALEELSQLGVDVSGVKLLRGRKTRIIFERLSRQLTFSPVQIDHEFFASCPICLSRPDDQQLARIRFADLRRVEERRNAAFVCFDRLTPMRERAAKRYRQFNMRTALDIGRIDYLRWFPATRIGNAFSAFDVVFLPRVAAESLKKRARLTALENIAGIGPHWFLITSDGHHGMSVYDNRNKEMCEHVYRPPPNITVVDPAGAGDAFLASFIYDLALLANDMKIEGCTYNTVDKLIQKGIYNLFPVLQHVGARGHIPEASSHIPIVDPQWKGLSLNSIRELIDPDEECPFCGTLKSKASSTLNSKSTMNNRSTKQVKVPLSKRNVGRLLLNRLLFAIEREEAILSCRELLGNQTGTAYCIGTGGSYPVAVFLAQLLGLHSGLFAQPLRPFDYIRVGAKSSHIFIISYSGATADCGDAIKRAKELGVRQIVLVTSSAKPELGQLLRLRDEDKIISYGRPLRKDEKPSKERGFISFAGTVAPCALWTAAVSGSIEMMKFAEMIEDNNVIDDSARLKLSSSIKAGETLSIFGGGLAWPAMLDIESKFVESGLGIVQLHEVKDFSHGRFISLFDVQKKSPVVFLAVGGSLHPYERVLVRILEKGQSVISIVSKDNGIRAALELLIKVQFFTRFVGEDLERDISKPKIPHAGLRLYKWRQGLL